MSNRARKFFVRFYLLTTLLTFVGLVVLVIFEAHVRWSLNQNFSILDPGALASLMILFAAQLLGLVWLSRS